MASAEASLWRAVAAPVGLLLVLVLYSLLGATIFQSIEGPHETHEKTEITQLRQQIVDDLWKSNSNMKNKNSFSKRVGEELKRYESQLYSAYTSGINSDAETEVWDFWGSLVYCATIYTTIGYGHIAPATTAGRVATIVYATIGVPLCLIVLAEFGKLFTRLLKALYSIPRRMVKQCQAGDPEDYAIDEEFNLPVWIAIAITVAYMVAGAYMYQYGEGWELLDGFYFIFISISTIGFGDVLPENNEFFMASFAYQLFGLALAAMVINVIMENLQVQLNSVRDQVLTTGRTIGIDLYPPVEDESKEKAE